MTDRKQKIKELMEDFKTLRRAVVFDIPRSINIPRITPSQWGALMCIEQHGESTVKDVAKTLGITSSASTQLIDGLVASGYVTRKTDKNDRRAVTLTLSKRTRAKVDKMKKQIQSKFFKFFEVLSDKEFDQYIRLNKKIVKKLLK